MKQNALYLLFIGCCIVWTTGCPAKVDEEGRKNISGTVTLDGTPIGRGNIQFAPQDTQAPQGAVGTGGSTEIVAGKYSLKRDLGLFSGTYKVKITSVVVTDPKTGQAPDPVQYNGSPESFKHEQIVPDKYNTITTLEITVGEDKNQTHDFTLTK